MGATIAQRQPSLSQSMACRQKVWRPCGAFVTFFKFFFAGSALHQDRNTAARVASGIVLRPAAHLRCTIQSRRMGPRASCQGCIFFVTARVFLWRSNGQAGSACWVIHGVKYFDSGTGIGSDDHGLLSTGAAGRPVTWLFAVEVKKAKDVSVRCSKLAFS